MQYMPETTDTSATGADALNDKDATCSAVEGLKLEDQAAKQGDAAGGNAPAAQEAAASGSLPNFSGTWLQDKAASSSMEEALDLMKMNGLVRQAVKLVRGVELKVDATTFTMAVFSIFPWFKVRETYAFSGEQSQCNRRDLRKGKHTGTLQRRGRELLLQMSWGEPLGGSGTDVFSLVSEDELHILSTVEVAGRSVQFNKVFRRKGAAGAGKGKGGQQQAQAEEEQEAEEEAAAGGAAGPPEGVATQD